MEYKVQDGIDLLDRYEVFANLWTVKLKEWKV